MSVDKQWTNIILAETSYVVCEGLSILILKSGKHYNLFRVNSLEEMERLLDKQEITTVVINPGFFVNRETDLKRIKRIYPQINWIALIYSFYPPDLLKNFHDIIAITDPVPEILKKIQFTTSDIAYDLSVEQLTERETDVLVHLANGLSNKEVADKLNISIHTVVSHRKNIVEKTGIKSLSGLTIYAISKKLISLDLDL